MVVFSVLQHVRGLEVGVIGVHHDVVSFCGRELLQSGTVAAVVSISVAVTVGRLVQRPLEELWLPHRVGLEREH